MENALNESSPPEPWMYEIGPVQVAIHCLLPVDGKCRRHSDPEKFPPF
jgi:hypothetical protein